MHNLDVLFSNKKQKNVEVSFSVCMYASLHSFPQEKKNYFTFVSLGFLLYNKKEKHKTSSM